MVNKICMIWILILINKLKINRMVDKMIAKMEVKLIKNSWKRY